MTTANELLRRALEHLDLAYKHGKDLDKDIRAFLADEPEVEPVFIRPDHLALARKSPFLCQVGPVQVADFVPLYTRPEPAIRKPMTEEEMRKGSGEWAHLHNIFEEGIRFAEKHHGIGGDDER